MIIYEYDAQTGQVTVIENDDEPIVVTDFEMIPQIPTEADRIAALESAMLDMILGGA